MIILLIVGAMALGGGIYAAANGYLGTSAKADVAKVKADILAELKKAETSVDTEVKTLIANIKSKL